VRFDNDYRGIIWILTRRFLSESIHAVFISLRDLIHSIGGFELNNFGCGFGKYNLVIELTHKSPRTISSLVWQLGEQLKISSICEENNFSPSLTLGKRILGNSIGQLPIRTYSFFCIKHSKIKLFQNYMKKYQDIDDFELIWNSSSYNYLLILSDSSYFNICKRIFDIRKAITKIDKNILVDGRTFFSLAWDKEQEDLARDKIEKEKIIAPIFVKTKGYQICESDSIFEMPGYYDKFIYQTGNSLYEIQKHVHTLMAKNPLIENTSTYPLMENSGGE